MKLITLLILSMIIITTKSQTLEHKNKICLAIYKVESSSGYDLINESDTASAGHFQMRRIYVDEVNRICKAKKFTYDDRFNFTKSVMMFFIYNNFHNPNWDYQQVAVMHGTGNKRNSSEKALNYWNKVKKCL